MNIFISNIFFIEKKKYICALYSKKFFIPHFKIKIINFFKKAFSDMKEDAKAKM